MREITTTITCYDKSSPTTGVIGGNLVKQGNSEKRLLFTAAEMIGSYSAGQLLKVKMAANVSENDENNILVQRLPADGIFGTLSNATDYVLLQRGIDGYYYADLEKLRTVAKTEPFDCVIRLKNDSVTGVQIIACATTSSEMQYEPKLMLLQGDIVAEDHEKKPVVFERSIGDKGRYQINFVKQKTHFDIELFSAYGYRMPMTLSLSYHENIIDNEPDFGCHLGFGNGWKLNYQQYIVVRGHECLYLDASGNCRRFLRMTTNSDVWYDETGSGFVLKKVGGMLLVEHEDGVKYTFNAYDDYVYRLTKIEDGYTSAITFTYTGNDLTQITDGMGRTATLVYNAQDFVSSITTPDQKTIEFSYATIGENTMLSSISSFEVSATIGYNTENKLSRIDFSSGEIVEFNTITGDGIYTHSITESLKTTNASPAQSVIETFRYGKAEDGNYKVKDSKDKVYVYRYVDGTIPNVQFIAAHEDVATAPMNQFPISDYESFRTYCKTVGAQPLTAPSEPIVLTNEAAYGSTGQSHVWNVDPLFFSKRGLKRGTYCIDYSYRFQFAECEQARNATAATKLSVVCKVGNTIVGNPDLMIDVTSVPLQAENPAASATDWKHSYLTFSLPLDVDVTSVTATFQNLIAHSAVQIANVKFVSTQSHQWNWGGGSHSGSNLANCEITSPSGTYSNGASIDYPAYPTASFQYTNTAGTTKTVYYDELSQRDWLKNLRSYANKNADGSFTLWYNDNRKCIKNAKNLVFNCKKNNGNNALVSAATVMDNLIAVYHDSECVRVKKYTVTGAEDVYLTEEETLYNAKGKFIATTTYNDKMQPITVTDFEGKTLTYEYDTYGNVSKKSLTAAALKPIVLEETIFANNDDVFTETKKVRSGTRVLDEISTYDWSSGEVKSVKPISAATGYENNYTYTNSLLSKISKTDPNGIEQTINYAYTAQQDLASCLSATTKFITQYGAYRSPTVYSVNNVGQTSETQTEIAKDVITKGQGENATDVMQRTQKRSGSTVYDQVTSTYDAYNRLVQVQLTERVSGTVKNGSIIWIYSDDAVEELDSVNAPNLSASEHSKLRKVIDMYAKVVYTYHYYGNGQLSQCCCYNRPSNGNYRTPNNLLYTFTDLSDIKGRVVSRVMDLNEAPYTLTANYTYRDTVMQNSEQITSAEIELTPQNENIIPQKLFTDYTYDEYDRLENCSRHFYDDGTPFTKSYTYYIVSGTGGSETSSVPRGEQDVLNGIRYGLSENRDTKGNISYISQTQYDLTEKVQIASKRQNFTYDAWNRLTQEKLTVDSVLQKTTNFTYDVNGNILTKTISKNGETTTIPYAYDNRNRLISYNGQTIAYDDLGNPLNWHNVTEIDYSRGRMDAFKKAGVQYQYTYGGSGLRVGKTIAGTETQKFYYQGDKLIAIKNSNGNHMQFVYDQTGVCAMCYNNRLYVFRKNLYGDITGIISHAPELVAEYEYDAWGNCKVLNPDGTENIDPAFIGNINPFRYRGYFYDQETGFYYLQTRYYDPAVGRFLSPDNPDYLDYSTLGGLNLYAYCYNNPVMHADPSGHFIISALIIGAIIGAAVGFGTAAYIDYQDDGQVFNGSVAWYDYLGATVLGGAIGAGLGAFAGMSFSATLPTGFALAQTSAGTMALVATGSMTLTVTGAQVLGVAGLLGATYMFSKHNPGMTNKSPFSWTTNQEGMDAMRKFGGDANKAADYIMNNHFDNWKYGAGQARNAIKKWLDRVIRKMVGM